MTLTSITDLDGILTVSARAALESEEDFAVFKQLPGFKRAIERLPAARGAEYREIVLKQTPELLQHLEKFRENDAVGSPTLAPYAEGLISPTTWRYIKVLSDLKMLFGSLDGWRIAEIGAGYGGQAKIIGDLYDIESYTIYDLDLVSRLAQKYLSRTESPLAGRLRLADFAQLGQSVPETYDLVISNWALSECTIPLQRVYIQHVLRQSTHGYITYNQMSHLSGVVSYRKQEFIDALGLPAELMPEGLSGIPPEMENFILHWSSPATAT